MGQGGATGGRLKLAWKMALTRPFLCDLAQALEKGIRIDVHGEPHVALGLNMIEISVHSSARLVFMTVGL